MHIEQTSHENGLSGKVYTYEGDFDVSDDAITWNAKVTHAQEQPRVVTGTIPITSPAVAAIADKVVRDAIVKSIDANGALKTTATAAPATLSRVQPVRSQLHDALDMFVGEWRAEGRAYGSSTQSIADPKAEAKPWKSSHSARWHTGRFFLVHDEKAHIGADPLDTLSVMGVDAHSRPIVRRRVRESRLRAPLRGQCRWTALDLRGPDRTCADRLLRRWPHPAHRVGMETARPLAAAVRAHRGARRLTRSAAPLGIDRARLARKPVVARAETRCAPSRRRSPCRQRTAAGRARRAARSRRPAARRWPSCRAVACPARVAHRSAATAARRRARHRLASTACRRACRSRRGATPRVRPLSRLRPHAATGLARPPARNRSAPPRRRARARGPHAGA